MVLLQRGIMPRVRTSIEERPQMFFQGWPFRVRTYDF